MAKRILSFKARKGTLKTRVQGLRHEIAWELVHMDQAFRNLFELINISGEEFVEEWEANALLLYQQIQARTPWLTGQARRGWIIERKVEADGTIFVRIYNLVPYIVYLEYGSSRKAPKGMVRISMVEFTERMNKAVRQLRKRLRGG